MGGSGVQRVAKWCKYLPGADWDVTVLTAEPGAYFAFDDGLLEEVERAGVRILRTRSMGPTASRKGRRTVAPPSEWKRRLFTWLTGLLFIPDNKRGWKGPALEAASVIFDQKPVDLVLSSAPPYTCFLVGAELARRWGVPHMMDYRDDWLDNPRHRYPTPVHRWLHQSKEREVLQQADLVMAINRQMAERIKRRVPGVEVRVLPQGFDPEDMHEKGASSRSPDGKLRLLYAGMFYDAQQPDTFLSGVAMAMEQDPSLVSVLDTRFVGLFPEAKKSLIDACGLQEVVTLVGYRSHTDTVQELAQADILWMTIGRQPGEDMISTGKLFEYMGSGKPILALIPEGAAQEALEGYGAATVIPPDRPDVVAQSIRALVASFRDGTLPSGNPEWTRPFDRQRQVGTLTAWFNECLAKQND
ncbi:MAG: glycosyltransferase [Bacteroidetes bacterium]|nr:glycosyltransferase [Bacteroidota bacterium]